MILKPGVSALSVTVSQPDDDISPSTCQLTVTLLRYQPFSPSVPEIVTVICGGVATALGAKTKESDQGAKKYEPAKEAADDCATATWGEPSRASRALPCCVNLFRSRSYSFVTEVSIVSEGTPISPHRPAGTH